MALGVSEVEWWPVIPMSLIHIKLFRGFHSTVCTSALCHCPNSLQEEEMWICERGKDNRTGRC